VPTAYDGENYLQEKVKINYETFAEFRI